MKTNLNSKRSFGLLAVIFALPVLMMYQNCSKVGVSDIPDGVGVSNTGGPGSGCAVGDPTCNTSQPPTTPTDPPKTCTTPIVNASNVKVFFLLDISGSNQSGQSGVLATDPSGNMISSSKWDGVCDSTDVSMSPKKCKPWRLGVLEKFLGLGGQPAAYMKSGFSFQLGYFQGKTANALITSGGKTTFADGVTMQAQITNAVNMFLLTKDNDNTPYQAVLNMAESAIKQDMSVNPSVKSKYVIIMLTDGMPTDFSGSQSQIESDLKSSVAHLANVSPGYITFNTVLYYSGSAPSTSSPQQRDLQAMADAGSGKMLLASSTNIPFQIDNDVKAPTGGSSTCPDGVMP